MKSDGFFQLVDAFYPTLRLAVGTRVSDSRKTLERINIRINYGLTIPTCRTFPTDLYPPEKQVPLEHEEARLVRLWAHPFFGMGMHRLIHSSEAGSDLARRAAVVTSSLGSLDAWLAADTQTFARARDSQEWVNAASNFILFLKGHRGIVKKPEVTSLLNAVRRRCTDLDFSAVLLYLEQWEAEWPADVQALSWLDAQLGCLNCGAALDVVEEVTEERAVLCSKCGRMHMVLPEGVDRAITRFSRQCGTTYRPKRVDRPQK